VTGTPTLAGMPGGKLEFASMATLLADSPSAPPDEQAPPNGSAGTPAAPITGPPPPLAPARTCAKCGAVMADDQDWCLQCGAGAPGSLGTPSWRSAAAILGATVLLVLIAAAAAYAALSKSGNSQASSTTVARVAPPAASAPITPSPTPTTPPPGTLGTTPTPKASIPPVKTPKIPLTAVVPKATPTTTTPSSSSGTGTSTATTPSTPATGGANSEESAPTAILLDTDAASTYNPYSYPASGFGDPSLAIDGDSTTAWTAKLDSATAPKMAQGLLIDLKTKQKLAAVGLITSTPGMTVQVYGANTQTAPSSITDPAWVALSRSLTVKKKRTHIKLRDSKQTFTFVTLWISRAPEASIGTPEAPGHVDVNELELFPAGQ
jgi:hypothetical protein